MKILVIDRDEVSGELIQSQLDALGHSVDVYESKNDAVEHMTKEPYDLVFLNPDPLTSPQPVVLNIRRSVSYYPYIVHIGYNAGHTEAIKSGMNNALLKPVNPDKLSTVLQSAQRLNSLIRRIGDDSEDFPSAGGIISRSAFYQLFFSGIERADRYGECTYVIFISISNYQKILEMDGPYAADFSVAKLSQYLTRLRRMSDIIGQTAKYEYSLLLQRPQYETEPIDAAKRFGEALKTCHNEMFFEISTDIELNVKLVSLPDGVELVDHLINKTSVS